VYLYLYNIYLFSSTTFVSKCIKEEIKKKKKNILYVDIIAYENCKYNYNIQLIHALVSCGFIYYSINAYIWAPGTV